MQYSSSLILLFSLVALCVSAHVRRQAEEDSDIWDATIRDKTDTCNEMGAMAGPAFCKMFEKCCSMFFDPLNGDKCQVIENTCQEGGAASQCVFRNCTEMVTTTTTTTMATTRENTNSAVSAMSFISLVSLWLLQ